MLQDSHTPLLLLQSTQLSHLEGLCAKELQVLCASQGSNSTAGLQQLQSWRLKRKQPHPRPNGLSLPLLLHTLSTLDTFLPTLASPSQELEQIQNKRRKKPSSPYLVIKTKTKQDKTNLPESSQAETTGKQTIKSQASDTKGISQSHSRGHWPPTVLRAAYI